jgi:hypothetical protein
MAAPDVCGWMIVDRFLPWAPLLDRGLAFPVPLFPGQDSHDHNYVASRRCLVCSREGVSPRAGSILAIRL